MQGKTVLLTGGNAGIGKEAARQLAARGADVILTSRDPARGEQAVADLRADALAGSVRWLPLDLADFASIRALAERVREEVPRLDVLVNNAGALLGERRLTRDGFEMTFGVNHLGHVLLTDLLLPLLRSSRPARVVVVASEAHRAARDGIDFDDLQRERAYHPFRVYAESKLANILFARELARREAEHGLSVFAVHPGVVASRFAQDGDARGLIPLFYRIARPFLRDCARGARSTVYAASAPGIEGQSGAYFLDERARTPSRVARNDALARRLWEVSAALVAKGHP